MMTFLVVLLMVYTFLNLLGLLESAIMLRTSTLEINVKTVQLLQQGYRFHNLRKSFAKFYLRHYELISKYNVGYKKVQVGKDQEKSQSEKDSHSKNQGGKKTN